MYARGIPAAYTISVMAGVASVLTGASTMASTPDAMKFWIWLIWVPTSSRASRARHYARILAR